MGRELMTPRTDRTTRIPSGVASPVTTNHTERFRVSQLDKCRQLKKMALKLVPEDIATGAADAFRRGVEAVYSHTESSTLQSYSLHQIIYSTILYSSPNPILFNPLPYTGYYTLHRILYSVPGSRRHRNRRRRRIPEGGGGSNSFAPHRIRYSIPNPEFLTESYLLAGLIVK